jgi:hypothetical protein
MKPETIKQAAVEPQVRSSALLECILRVEHGWVTMRNRAGKLLWTDTVKNVDTHQGIVLADLEPLIHEENEKWKHSNDPDQGRRANDSQKP